MLHNPLVATDDLQQTVCVNITRVQKGVCGECDVVSVMQSWIHPRWPVAAAADIVFHNRPACWQHA